MNTLSPSDRQRFARHLSLPGFGEAHQARLINARVLVAGCGGLAHPFVQYLAASGVGYIGLVDYDKIEISNLHRQTLFSSEDIGKFKAEVLADRCRTLYPASQFNAYNLKLDSSVVPELLSGYDFVADCTDNFPARYLLSDACGIYGRPLVYGALFRDEGQVALFHGKNKTSYRDLFPSPPDKTLIPDCATGGIIGAVAGTIGSMMALEAIRWLSGYGARLDGKILHLDLQEFRTQIIKIMAQKEHSREHLERDYEEFCNRAIQRLSEDEISVEAFRQLLSRKEDFVLIDVREQYEYDAFNIGGQLIPLDSLPLHVSGIPRDKTVIIHCRSGARSAAAVQWLRSEHSYSNVYNLTGGILAWQETEA